jgi:hypothetical protein
MEAILKGGDIIGNRLQRFDQRSKQTYKLSRIFKLIEQERLGFIR